MSARLRLLFSASLFASTFGLLGGIGSAVAQELTYKEAREILLQAENTAAEYENLLNAISNTNSGPAEIQLFVEGSYTPGPNQIFLNKDVVVEDNIDPTHVNAQGAQDKPISAYLSDFDVSYVKTDDPSVKFDKRKMGPIRRQDILFVNVLYENTFSSKAKTSTDGYKPTQRVMTLRAERNGNKWRTFIAGVRFATASDSSATPPPDVVVIQKTPEQAKAAAKAGGEVSGKDVFAEVMQEEARREYAESRQQREKAYADAMKHGDEALAGERYDEASEAFTQAISINSYDYRARARLQEVERSRERKKAIEAKQTAELEDLLAEADRVQDYAVAKSATEQLIRRNPSNTALQDKLRILELRIIELEQIKAKIRVMDNEAAIRQWDKEISNALKNDDTPARLADLRVGRAKNYLAKNDFKRALADLTKALEGNLSHREALLVQAKVHLTMNEPYKALNDYTLIITNSRFSPAFYKERAAVKMRVRDTAGAIADFNQAIGLAPQQADLYFGRAQLHMAKKNYPAAITDFGSAITYEPTVSRNSYQRGLAYLAAGDVAHAAEDFAQARQKNASADELREMAAHAWRLYEQGAVEAKSGLYTQALNTLSEALSLNPDLVEASLEKGTVLMKMLDFKAAEACFTAALEARKTYTPVRVARAQVRLEQKNTEAALQDCMVSLQQEAQNYNATVTLANVYAAQDRLQDAENQYKRAEAIYEEQPQAYLAHGRALSRAGKTDKAEDYLEKAVKYSKGAEALPYAELGENALRAHEYKDALNYAEKSLKTGVALPQTYLVKGRALVGMGQNQPGISELLRVADKDPEQYLPAAHLYISNAYLRQGLPSRARQELDKLKPERRAYLGTAYWVAVGDLRLAVDSLDGARAAYTQAVNLDETCATARYGLARCAAKTKDTDKVLALLKESLKTRPYSRDYVEGDASFAYLAQDKRFKALLKEAY